MKIVDSIQDRGINQVSLDYTFYSQNVCTGLQFITYENDDSQVYIIGGDGTQKGAAVIYEVILGG